MYKKVRIKKYQLTNRSAYNDNNIKCDTLIIALVKSVN